MILVVEVIASFIAGVIAMPFIFEGYIFLRRRELQKYYTNQMVELENEHKGRMHSLTKEWNDIVETYHLSFIFFKIKRCYFGTYIL